MKLTYTVHNIMQREPFVTNKSTVLSARHVFVQLSWEGFTGLGTALITRNCGMTEEDVRPVFDLFAGLVSDASPFHLEQVLGRLEGAVSKQPMAIAAVDMAMHDLLGKIANLPLHRMWGLAGLPIAPTGLSLGVLPEAQLLAKVRHWAHWPILKLKMTKETDISIVRRVRALYGGRIWVDGNGCWDAAGAIAAAEEFHRSGVELLEQPIRAGTPDILRSVREKSPMPIVADEDSVGPENVLRLAGCADVIMIKLLRCGGIRRAMRMIHLARGAGLKVMLGCITEGVLGITAIAQMAGLADYLDLDGHLELLDDPHIGIAVDCGRVTLPDGPGLGVEPSDKTPV